jgi:hypothetical protein
MDLPPAVDSNDFDPFEYIDTLVPKTLLRPPSPLPTDPYEHAKAAYHLLDPPRGADWPAYLEARAAANEQSKRVIESSDFISGGGQIYLRVVRDTMYAVPKGALPEGQWERVASGAVVTDLEAYTDDDCNVSACLNPNASFGCSCGLTTQIVQSTIVTRIHSPVSAASLDLRFIYTFIRRCSSVSWVYARCASTPPHVRPNRSVRVSIACPPT